MRVTIRFQSSGSVPGSGTPVAMSGQSLTIGRGEQNDMVLPDPDRTLSKRHCVIEDQNGDLVVVDISTNGTFLNYGKSPLGPTPTPLNNGDILSVGPYELVVDVEAEMEDPLLDPIAAPNPVQHAGNAGAAPLEDVDFLDDLLGARDTPAGPGAVQRPELGGDGLLPPLDDDDIIPKAPEIAQGASTSSHTPSVSDQMIPPTALSNVIPDDWDDDFPEPEVKESPPPPKTEKPNPFAKEAGPAAPPLAQEPKAETVVADPSGQADATLAFLQALGGDDLRIEPEDLSETMAQLGNVLRITIDGMREILMTRTAIKSEFRIEQTMIQKGGNNPLKFSMSTDQAIDAMSRRNAKGYLGAEEAAKEALNDIKAHEMAMVTGMEAALRGILQQLDPEALEEKIQTAGGLGGILKSKKARYWEIYEKIYADLSNQAETDFQELFSREFARAYREQLERLK